MQEPRTSNLFSKSAPLVEELIFTSLLLTLFLQTSCTSETDQQRRRFQQVASWIASTEMIADARARNRVPAAFAGLALERCGQEISSLSAGAKRRELSSSQLAALADLPSLIVEAREAASSQDRPRTERVISALERTRNVLGPPTELP